MFKAFAMFGTGAMVASPADSRQKVGDVRSQGKHVAETFLRLFVTLDSFWSSICLCCELLLQTFLQFLRNAYRLCLLRWFCLACSLTECTGSFSADDQPGHFLFTVHMCPQHKALAASKQTGATWQQHQARSPCLQVEMDGSHFAKLCRECGLVGGKLTTTAVDIAFSKAKNKARQSPRGCSPSSCPMQAGAATASTTGVRG